MLDQEANADTTRRGIICLQRETAGIPWHTSRKWTKNMENEWKHNFPRPSPGKPCKKGALSTSKLGYFPTSPCELRVLNDIPALTASYCTSSIPSHELQKTPEDSNAAEWRRLWVFLGLTQLWRHRLRKILSMLQLWKKSYKSSCRNTQHNTIQNTYYINHMCIYIIIYIHLYIL